MRAEKSYNGKLMEIGKSNEEAILSWLKRQGGEVIDFREFRLAQRIDVDFGVETVDRTIVLLEIKSDKYISENGNLLFENHRINHFVDCKWFYLGWGWRSPAQKLLIRNPETNCAYLFHFDELRRTIARYIATIGKNIKMSVVETDKQKTTFNYLIPFKFLNGIYKKYVIAQCP